MLPVPLCLVPMLPESNGDSMNNTDYDSKISNEFKYNVNLIHVNPSEFPLAFMNVGKEHWDYRYNIGYWLWELEEFPEEWIPLPVFFML